MKLYAIVKTDGTLRRVGDRKHRSYAIYDTEGKARNNARADGDSVVEFEIDLTREPLFIRSRKVGG